MQVVSDTASKVSRLKKQIEIDMIDHRKYSTLLSEKLRLPMQPIKSSAFLGLCLLSAATLSHSREPEPIGLQVKPAAVSPATPPPTASKEKVAQVEAGLKAYASACATCHQATGEGIPNVFPPLAGSEWVKETETKVIAIVLCGLTGPITVKGYTYPGMPMPAFGESGTFQWTNEQIADALTYVRQAWGNQGGAVSPARVAAVRAQLGKRGEMTEAELKQLP